MASWGARTPTRSSRRRGSSTCRISRCSRRCAREIPIAPEAFAANWGYESVEKDWRTLVERPDIDLIDIASPNDTHAEIAIAAARAGKMVLCEKPLGRNGDEAKRMVDAVESAGVPNMVWYNYRRVPAVTLIKVAHRRGAAWPGISLPREISAGLDDLARSAAGRRGLMASRRGRRRQRRHRRPARALHRYRDVAERSDRRSDGDDRDLHQGTQAQRHRTSRAGRHRRCERVSLPVRERIARDVRSDAIRARPQGAVHARDQRRARVGLLGSPRPASRAGVRSSRRGTAARVEERARHRRRPSRT